MPRDLSSQLFSRDLLLFRQSLCRRSCMLGSVRPCCLILLLKGVPMSISDKESQTSKRRHQRRDAGVLQVPAPKFPPCGDGFFCDEAWAGITDKLGLSPRQVEIVRCVLAGQEDRLIAVRLDVSPRTVHAHVRCLHEKLGVQNRMELVTQLLTAYRAWRTEAGPPADCRQNCRVDLG